MPITMQQFQPIFSSALSHRESLSFDTIKLTDLFPHALEKGRLQLEHIDFSYFNQRLFNIDFSACDINTSCFTGLTLNKCVFEDCLMDKSTSDTLFNRSDSSNDRADLSIESLWMQHMMTHYPEKIFDYAFLLKKDFPSTPFLVSNSSFLIFNIPADEPIKNQPGWKLHLSVDLRYIACTFNLVAPILHRYDVHYKIIDLSRVNTDRLGFFSVATRLLYGAQFTLYLNPNSINQDKVLRLMQEITTLLTQHHIPIGEIPSSDKKTISPYFTLRNDQITLPDIYTDFFPKSFPDNADRYISAISSGRNFNPFGAPNPYLALLPQPNEPFNLGSHFESLSLTEDLSENDGMIFLDKLCFNLRATLIAFLREYTQVETLKLETLLEMEEEEIRNYIIPLKAEHAHLSTEKRFLSSIQKATDLLGYIDYFTRNQDAIEALNYSPDEVTPEFYDLIEDFKAKARVSGPTLRFMI